MGHPDAARALEAVLDAAETRLERLTGQRHAWHCLEAIPAVEWHGPISGAAFGYESEVMRAALGEPQEHPEAWIASELAALAHAARGLPRSVERAALVSELERHLAKLARLDAGRRHRPRGRPRNLTARAAVRADLEAYPTGGSWIRHKRLQLPRTTVRQILKELGPPRA
jgi:hypothetical protein